MIGGIHSSVTLFYAILNQPKTSLDLLELSFDFREYGILLRFPIFNFLSQILQYRDRHLLKLASLECDVTA